MIDESERRRRIDHMRLHRSISQQVAAAQGRVSDGLLEGLEDDYDPEEVWLVLSRLAVSGAIQVAFPRVAFLGGPLHGHTEEAPEGLYIPVGAAVPVEGGQYRIGGVSSRARGALARFVPEPAGCSGTTLPER